MTCYTNSESRTSPHHLQEYVESSTGEIMVAASTVEYQYSYTAFMLIITFHILAVVKLILET